jgi:hypothetical protein
MAGGINGRDYCDLPAAGRTAYARRPFRYVTTSTFNITSCPIMRSLTRRPAMRSMSARGEPASLAGVRAGAVSVAYSPPAPVHDMNYSQPPYSTHRIDS